MKKTLILFTIATVSFFSCKKDSKSAKKNIKRNYKPLNWNETSTKEKSPNIFDKHYIHTHFEYEDSSGTTLSIENSLPRGGHRYTDPEGKSFVYTIYWTRLSNLSADPLEVQINFPADSIPLTASSDIFFKLVLPPNKVETAQKALINNNMSGSKPDITDRDPVYNYGLLDLESVLDQRLHKPSSFQRILQPNDTVSFYVVNLFNKGVKGVVRTGLSLEEQELFYTVNGKKIRVGDIAFQE